MAADLEPWFAAATHLLDVRRQDRLLAVGVGVDGARSLAALVGKAGVLMAVLTDAVAAEQLAALDLPQTTVLAARSWPAERLGTFDAVLIAPRLAPLPLPAAIAELLRANLRPGGRFVVDVPGPDLVPDLTAAARELGWPLPRLQALQGHADDELADALRSAGLRSVTGLLGAHLLQAESPAELVLAFTTPGHWTDDEVADLTHTLVRRRAGTGPLDVLVHRTRLQGQR